jgi:hypothetical protein
LAKYNKIDNVPAKVFFEILKTKNYQLLKPKPKEQGLEGVFMSIYDDFFIQSDNPEAQRYFELTKNIAFLEYKIAVIKKTLHFLFYNKTTKEMRLDIIKALKIGCGIEIDENAPFIDEVQRVLNIELGAIKNDLNIEKMEFDKMIKKSSDKDFSYYDSIAGLSNVLPSNSLLKENMTLAVYVTLEKLAHKVIENNKKK